MSPRSVSDIRSNPNDQIAHAARVIGRSKARRRVFEFVYFGKKKIKAVAEIASRLKLTQKQVLNAGNALAKNELVEQVKQEKRTAYRKDGFYDHNKRRILNFASNKAKLSQFPTKTNPRPMGVQIIRLPSR